MVLGLESDCSVLPYELRETGAEGSFEGSRCVLEFRLLYQGELQAGGNKSPIANKHHIRRALHPQLRRLWQTDMRLQQLAKYRALDAVSRLPVAPTDEDRFKIGISEMGRNWAAAGYQLLPLIADRYGPLRCVLDILLLRPGDKQIVLRQGDIDAQVKTLFDALRLPKNRQETDNCEPQSDENPLYCLLEDDRLVSEVHVVGDNLLLLPNTSKIEPTDAFVIIHVKIKHVLGGAVERWLD